MSFPRAGNVDGMMMMVAIAGVSPTMTWNRRRRVSFVFGDAVIFGGRLLILDASCFVPGYEDMFM